MRSEMSALEMYHDKALYRFTLLDWLLMLIVDE